MINHAEYTILIISDNKDVIDLIKDSFTDEVQSYLILVSEISGEVFDIIKEYKGIIKPFHKIEKHSTIEQLCKLHGFPYKYFKDLKIKNIDKKQLLRNCISPELGKHIFIN